jgi:hypothetical protein
MKSKLNKHLENNFKRVSKLTFIPFGILVALMSTSVFANDVTHERTIVAEISAVLQKSALTEDADTTKTIRTSYKKTIEDEIEEDNRIIESNISNEVYPLDFDKILIS